MSADPDPGTRTRLLEAAGELFAEHGFRGATLRDIADRAGANLAAANYHFGSKQALYLEVVSAQFERLERRLAALGAAADPAALARLSREGLLHLLQTRVQAMLDNLLEDGGLHGTLMQRELCDPSEALPLIVARFIEPQRDIMRALVTRLAPELTPGEAQWCTESVVGMASFYLTHRPALLLLHGRAAYPPGFTRQAAEHVAAFALGGIEQLAAQRRRGTRARPRARRAARR
jgi:AcrR family transcriptional regulator